MTLTLNAIEKMLPEGIELLAYAGSGYLRAIVWKSKEGCQFCVFREDPESGDLRTTLTPFDVEHLARLTTVIADVLHQLGNPEDPLTDDLGCLSHTLSCTLGVDLETLADPMTATLQ